jgi:hypothetical protein
MRYLMPHPAGGDPVFYLNQEVAHKLSTITVENLWATSDHCSNLSGVFYPLALCAMAKGYFNT